MSRRLETSAERSSRGQKALARRFFTDDDIYRREGSLFAADWLAIGPARMVPAGATPIAVDGNRLLALRDGDGGLRVVHNVCRHRGTVLCEEPCPDQRRIVCPYHGWSYTLDGRLASAPHMRGTEGFRTEDYPLLEVESALWQGILFVRLQPDEPAASVDARLSPLTAILEAWDPASLEVVASSRYDVKANWKLLFQNYSECYHCPTLHPPLNRLTPFRNSDNLLKEGPILGGPMRLSNPDGSMTTTGERCGPLIGDSGLAWTGQVLYFTVFPSLFISLHPDYVLLHRLERMAIDRTAVECWWLAPAGVGREALEPAVEFWDTTNRQDWWVCEQMQQGVSSSAYEPGPYSDLESLVAAFDRNYLRSLESSGDR